MSGDLTPRYHSLLRLSGAFHDPIAGFGNQIEEPLERRAEVFGVAIVRSHSRAKLGFVNELVGLRGVLERRLCAEEQRIDIRGRATLQQLARQLELRCKQGRVIRVFDFWRKIKARLNQRRITVSGTVPVSIWKVWTVAP